VNHLGTNPTAQINSDFMVGKVVGKVGTGLVGWGEDGVCLPVWNF